MTPAERHQAEDIARHRRTLVNPNVSEFEREEATAAIERLTAPVEHTSLLDPETICRWCTRPIGTHVAPDAKRTVGRPGERPSLSELGASLCPVVVANSKAGKGPWERLYEPPTDEEIAKWRESNLATEPMKPKKPPAVESGDLF